MAFRVGEDEVRDIVNNDPNIKMSPFIRMANTLTDRVNTQATTKGVTLTTAELTDIERLLSAFFYEHRDSGFLQRSTGKASGQFEKHPYLDSAIMLDHSGSLKSLTEGKRASMHWLGKPPSDQIDYANRD